MQSHLDLSHIGARAGREYARGIASTGADEDGDLSASRSLSGFSSLLREALGAKSWAAWGKDLKVGAADRKSVRIHAPSALHCERIWEAVGVRKLRAMWADCDPMGRTLELEPDPLLNEHAIRRPRAQALRSAAPPVAPPAEAVRPTAPAGAALAPQRTFETFVEGACNKVACAAARHIANDEDPPFRLLVLTGAYGAGKSHLLGAIAHAVSARGGAEALLAYNADGFRAEFVKSLSEKKGVDFKERVSRARTLVVDDAHLLDTSKKTQQELANVADAVLSAGGRVVFAADRPVEEIDGLDPRLAARLQGAVSCRLEQPDLDHRRRILQEMASLNPMVRRGVDIPENVLDYVASAIVAMPRDLEAALNTVISRTALVGLPVNLDTAREALAEMLNGAAKRVTVEEIQKAVAGFHGMPVSVLLSKRRTRDIVRPRQEAMFLCKELTTRSLPDIGKRFGDMDHTTVMHACKRIAKLMDENASVRSDVEQLRRLIRQRRERPTIQ
jgi:chromosomal replication initiator protein